jgi:GT2 family glycosyltransferase
MLSVITVTFNNFSELKETIESLPLGSVESVIVNGGSCDKTKTFLTNHLGESISGPDQGISDAFNKGFLLSRGEFILFLNSGDVLIDPDYLSESHEFLNSHPDFDFTYADICYSDQLAGELRIRSQQNLPAMPFLHPTLIVRRNLMERVGLFNLRYDIAMDLDFVYRLVKAGAKGKYFPKMVVRMDGSGISSTQHFKLFKEVFLIALDNKDFSFRAIFFFIKTGTKLIMKKILNYLGATNLITRYKKMIYRIK